jgi:hypothetical protein
LDHAMHKSPHFKMKEVTLLGCLVIQYQSKEEQAHMGTIFTTMKVGIDFKCVH